VLAHHFEERGLGARAGAVDLIGEQDVGEDRALAELEGAIRGLIETAAGDVGGQ
jgi:hypothetical protein